MDIVIYTRSDGGVSVVTPMDFSIEHIIENVIPRDATDIKIVDHTVLPTLPGGKQDRYFRDAWKISGSSVSVDMTKAKVVHMDKLKLLRKDALEKLDIEFMKALGQKKQKDADDVEAKRQSLRDMPETLNLNSARTPDELKEIIPDELRG